ncbi:MAG TPA: Uma2 family endonuclease [Methylomirabilota bacterium]|nr:Uma2 family endonuclease [Methylomirabilota bacterium]
MTDTMRTKRWTRVEYDRLIEKGLFGPDDRLELLGGLLVVREPQGSPHALGIRMAEEALRTAFASGWDVRGQLPVALDDESEPEPDVSVVPGSFRDYRHDHPARPVLVVEVAESSLGVDRGEKASLYARAGLADYWIVNLVAHVLEVYRDPAVDALAPYGWRYASVLTLRAGDAVTPVAAPESSIPVADLVP